MKPNQVVNHKDGNKTNNNLENLEICSKSENALHSCYILKNNVKPVIRIIENQEIEKDANYFADSVMKKGTNPYYA